MPIGIKDVLQTRDMPTELGSPIFKGRQTHMDSASVNALRLAGAVILGKTVTTEFAFMVPGPTTNPFDSGATPGGSSSGSSAAVASGLCPIAIGADGGGSIRIPAGFCGVVGLKGTFGRVSEWGTAPLCWSVAHMGPIAATARDCALGYAALAGPDPRYPASIFRKRRSIRESSRRPPGT